MENQQIPANLGHGAICQPLLAVNAHNQARDDNQLENTLRV